MNILVIGAGLLGRTIAEQLCEQGHDVSVIDENKEKLSLLSPDYSGISFVGFPLDLKALCEAGIESCDAVAVTVSDDNLGITVGQIAKNYFAIDTVITRISDPYRENIFEQFGLQTICSTNLSSQKMMDAILAPKKGNQISFGTHTVAFSTKEADKKFIGKSLAEVNGMTEVKIFALVGDTGLKFTLAQDNPQEQIQMGDLLVYTDKID